MSTETTEDTAACPDPIVPPGCAVVERMGWAKDGSFTATLRFPQGAPDLSFNVIWEAKPVRLVVVEPE